MFRVSGIYVAFSRLFSLKHAFLYQALVKSADILQTKEKRFPPDLLLKNLLNLMNIVLEFYLF